MSLNFPINPAGQTPVNTYSPTSSPVTNTDNNVTYVFDGVKWVTNGDTSFVGKAGDVMTGPLTVPTLNATDIITSNLRSNNLNGGPLAGFRNRIINGDFKIDQRFDGASTTITAAAALAYTADRFYAYCTGANVNGQRITVAGTQVDPFRYQFTGAASVTGIGIGQRIEAQNCRDLAGKTATLSLNLSNSLLTTVSWQAFYANTNDTFGTLASPTRTSIASGSFTVNSTYSRYSTQIAIPAAATTGIEIVFTVGAQTSGTWVIGQVQLEEGTVATPFESRPRQSEYVLCSRYFQWYLYNFLFWSTSANISHTIPANWPEMRVVPTMGALDEGIPGITRNSSNASGGGVRSFSTTGGDAFLTASTSVPNNAFVTGYRIRMTAEL